MVRGSGDIRNPSEKVRNELSAEPLVPVTLRGALTVVGVCEEEEVPDDFFDRVELLRLVPLEPPAAPPPMSALMAETTSSALA